MKAILSSLLHYPIISIELCSTTMHVLPYPSIRKTYGRKGKFASFYQILLKFYENPSLNFPQAMPNIVKIYYLIRIDPQVEKQKEKKKKRNNNKRENFHLEIWIFRCLKRQRASRKSKIKNQKYETKGRTRVVRENFTKIHPFDFYHTSRTNTD